MTDSNQFFRTEAHAQFGSGDGISTNNFPYFDGVIAAMLFDPQTNQYGLLTCSHVMNKGNATNCGGRIDNGQNAVLSNGRKIIGQWIYALRDDFFDIAVAAIGNGMQHEFEFNPQLAGTRSTNQHDVTQQTAITVLGMVSGASQGVIVKTGASATLNYNDEYITIQNLIVAGIPAGTGQYNTLTAKGDSGSLMIDQNSFAIGMVIGGDSEYTYAIPIESILEQTQMKFIFQNPDSIT